MFTSIEIMDLLKTPTQKLAKDTSKILTTQDDKEVSKISSKKIEIRNIVVIKPGLNKGENILL